VALIELLAIPAWAVEYRLGVTDLDDLNFSAHLQHSSSTWRGEARMVLGDPARQSGVSPV
jgi:hypothetical protein